MISKRGFTLIELLITLIILSMSLSLVGPSLFEAYKKIKIQQEVNILDSAIAKVSKASLFTNGAVLLADGKSVYFFLPTKKIKNKIHQFESLSFPEQYIVFNSHGYTFSDKLVYTSDEETIDMVIKRSLSAD